MYLRLVVVESRKGQVQLAIAVVDSQVEVKFI